MPTFFFLREIGSFVRDYFLLRINPDLVSWLEFVSERGLSTSKLKCVCACGNVAI